MTEWKKIARIAGIIWAVAILGLALLIWQEWQWGVSLERSIRKAGSKPLLLPPMVVLPEFSMGQDMGVFENIVSRPIFLAARRSAPPPESIPVMKKGQFLLLGVTITADHRVALLREVATGKLQRAEQGGLLLDMSVDKVEPDRVTLKLGDDLDLITLRVQRSSGASSLSVPSPAPPMPSPAAPGLPPSVMPMRAPSATPMRAPSPPPAPLPTRGVGGQLVYPPAFPMENDLRPADGRRH